MGRSWTAVVVVAFLMSVLGCSDDTSGGAAPTPSHSTNPASKPISDIPTSSRPDRPRRKPFEVDLPGTQRPWDPLSADTEPADPVGSVPGLPAVFTPPDLADDVRDAPIEAALVAVRRDAAAFLLSIAGEWRSLPLSGRYPSVGLSPGGTRAHTVDGSRTRAPIIVYDLTTGEHHEVGYPSEFGDWEYRTWVWIDERTLFLDDFSQGWVVDAATGHATRVDYPGSSLSWSFDSNGAVVAGAQWGQPRVLTDWASGRPRSVSMRTTGRLADLHVTKDSIVGTSYDGHPFAVIVADRGSLEPMYVLPLRDHQAAYGNGGLGVLALRDDGSVLLRVNALGRHDEGFRIVAWDPEKRTLGTIARIGITALVTFAEGLLRRTHP